MCVRLQRVFVYRVEAIEAGDRVVGSVRPCRYKGNATVTAG